ncbi:MAG: type II toxin-antitoxin system VapC family toxin [Fibrobacter sp.]|nr:type II toxin-antitoxin system VapC family toxin [Fibrobacter sp.]
MRYLLDTHVILWALVDSEKLPSSVRAMLQNPAHQFFFSTASVWEVAIKHERNPGLMLVSGKEYAEKCSEMGLFGLPVENKHVESLETLRRSPNVLPHKDPFDRIMLAQAKVEGFKFITHDSLIPGYNEPCVLSV